MKVKELIAELQKLNPELTVYRCEAAEHPYDADREYEIHTVEQTTHLTYNKNQTDMILDNKNNPKRHRHRNSGYYLRNIILIT